MATFWERLQGAAKAAIGAWYGDTGSVETVSSVLPVMLQGMGDADMERVQRYMTLRRYYEGNHKRHLKRRRTINGEGPDDNVTINLSRRVVDKGISFLFGKPLAWQLSETSDTPAEQFLRDVWGSEEKRMMLLIELAQNGGVTGDFFVQIVPPAEGEDLPRVINLDPARVFVRTDPNDIEKEWAFEIRYSAGNSLARTIHTKQVDGAFWETWTEVHTPAGWTATSDPQVWPFTWPMILHGKNLPNANSYYGKSDLEDADINDTINMVASNMNRTVRIFAHPTIWARGFGSKDSISADNTQMFFSTNDNATMGAIDAGKDLRSGFDLLAVLRTAFAEITGVPQSDPDRLKIGAQSGFSLRVLFNDLVLKTGIKRASYGAALVEINRRLCEMMGYGEKNVCKLHWLDPLPVDEREINDGDQFEIDNGIASKQTIATKRGRDWTLEQVRMAEERRSESNIGAELLAAFEAGPGGV